MADIADRVCIDWRHRVMHGALTFLCKECIALVAGYTLFECTALLLEQIAP